MKKRILGLALAMCALVPCGLAFSGCNEEVTVDVGTQAELEAAVADSSKDIIKLTDDINITTNIVVTRKVTLDLNGKTLSNDANIWSNPKEGTEHYGEDEYNIWSLISVKTENGNLTITGNGKLQTKKDDCYAIDVRSNAKVTIQNGEFVGNVSSVYVHTGLATINGGTYSIQQLSKYDDCRYILNLYDSNGKLGTAQIVVNGGVFKNFDPSQSDSENPERNFVSKGYKSVLVEDSKTDYEVVRDN